MKSTTRLSLAFAFLFFSFAPMQQDMIAYATMKGFSGIQPYISMVLYTCFGFGSFLVGARVVNYLGSKKSMILAASFYVIYGIFLFLGNGPILLICAVFTGFSASVLWMAQGRYLKEMSQESEMKQAYKFYAYLAAGETSGILLLVLGKQMNIGLPWLYAFFALSGCIAIVFLWGLQYKEPQKSPSVSDTTKVLGNIPMPSWTELLPFVLTCFFASALYGISFSIMPVYLPGTSWSRMTDILAVWFYVVQFLMVFGDKIVQKTGEISITLFVFVGISTGFLLLVLHPQEEIIACFAFFIFAICFAFLQGVVFTLSGELYENGKDVRFITIRVIFQTGGSIAAIYLREYLAIDVIMMIFFGVSCIALFLFLQVFLRRRMVLEAR